MAYTPQRIIDEAMSVATTGEDANSSPIIDAEYIAEELLPRAIRTAILQGKPSEAGELKRDFALTFVNGVASLSERVISECLNESSLFVADDEVGASFQPRYMDYVRPSYTQLGYYTVKDTDILYRASNGNVSEFDGSATLTAIAVPSWTALTDTLDISNDTGERAVLVLSKMIRNAN